MKSRATGFFIGAGLDGANIETDQRDGESGAGASLVLGYGFNRTFALLFQASGIGVPARGGGEYGLAHVDVGGRVHFRSGPNIVVPFLEFGLTGRGIDGDSRVGAATANVKASGGGVTLGGGLNAHFTPSVALSVAVRWTSGDFTEYRVNGAHVEAGEVRATSSRVHIGLIWFPNTARSRL